MKKYIVSVWVIVFLGAAIYFLLPPYQEYRVSHRKVNLGEYSFSTYPITESPVFAYDPVGCEKNQSGDVKIIKNTGEVVIPSIKQILYGKNFVCHDTYVTLFSQPEYGSFLYFKTNTLFPIGKFNPDLHDVYRLNINDFSVERLSVSDIFINTNGNYQASSSYRVLADGRHVVKWTSQEIYMIDLEKDSSKILYKAPEGQWLVSKIESTLDSWIRSFDINFSENQMEFGLFETVSTNDEKIIILDNDQLDTSAIKSVRVDYSPEFRLVKRITLPI